jgi:hypothetical protein
VLTILPWLIRNYLATGQFSIDAPFQYRIVASQYAYSNRHRQCRVEGESLGTLIALPLRDPRFVVGSFATRSPPGWRVALPLSHSRARADINLYWLRPMKCCMANAVQCHLPASLGWTR